MPWAKVIWEILLQVIFERGYLIPAINNATTDYVACAAVLARSIREWHPGAKICLLTDKPMEHCDFDLVTTLPHGDQATQEWKLVNDWQVFDATPFLMPIICQTCTMPWSTGAVVAWPSNFSIWYETSFASGITIAPC